MAWWKKALVGIGALVGVAALGLGSFVYYQTWAYAASLEKTYDVPIPKVERTTDPDQLERGKHLAESVTPCLSSDCHGKDLGGGKTIQLGPIGTITGPNISAGGLGIAYSDGELKRLIVHGVKKDGRGVRFMASHEFNWVSDEDITAVISYLRTLPPVERANGPIEIGTLGKVLDRLDKIPLDIARRIDHDHIEKAPPPSPTPAYGKFLARLCTGCHGNGLSGGPIPGAPPDMAIPLNLTPHATGLASWSLEDFKKAVTQGVRKDGRKLDPMMPVESFGNFDDVEMKALFSYLKSLPPTEFGNR